jgi:hypothetical protein
MLSSKAGVRSMQHVMLNDMRRASEDKDRLRRAKEIASA